MFCIKLLAFKKKGTSSGNSTFCNQRIERRECNKQLIRLYNKFGDFTDAVDDYYSTIQQGIFNRLMMINSLVCKRNRQKTGEGHLFNLIFQWNEG